LVGRPREPSGRRVARDERPSRAARWPKPGLTYPAALLAFVACSGKAPEPARPAGSEAVVRERAELADWLEHAPSSPYRAIVQYPLSGTVTLGPQGSDIPLTGLGPVQVSASAGRLRLTVDANEQPLARERLTGVGSYHLLASGPPGQTVLTVFGTEAPRFHPPSYYPDRDRWRFPVTLQGGSAENERVLGPDGTVVEGTEAGQVQVVVGTDTLRLRVFRLQTPGTEESDLAIYFQDATNGRGTYPAGRFVSLIPDGTGSYQLDFNRARNPFCAYSAVYACPAPWRGNRVGIAIEAGERYEGGGLESPTG